ncbi:myosin light chain kinase, smooth muscle [Aplochiton taeniatus]
MADVQLVTTRISKTSLSLGRKSPGNESPAFTLPPRNVRVSLGTTARVDGKVRGYPEPQVTWYRNGKHLTAGDRYVMEQNTRGTFSLLIQEVQGEDGGRYTCEAVNEAGSRQVTVAITVAGNTGIKYGFPSSNRTGGRFGVPTVESRPSIWGESPPKFVNKPSRVFVRVGQSGKFSAKITGRPQPQVNWLKGEKELPLSGRFSVYERSGLHFLEVSEVCLEDAGSYTCSVTNNAGTATATVELMIQVSAGGVSSGLPRVTWLKDGVAVRTSPGQTLHQEGSTHSLSLDRVNNRDEGTYGCTLTPATPGLLTSATWTFTVKSPVSEDQVPVFSSLLMGCSVTEGQAFTLQCSVKGKPAPHISWLLNECPMPSALSTCDNGLAKLTVQNSSQQDEGVYTCVAENQHGMAKCTARAVVTATPAKRSSRRSSGSSMGGLADAVTKPSAPVFIRGLQDHHVMDGSQVIMTVEVAGNPVPEVVWLHNGKEVTESEDFHFHRKDNLCSLLIQEVFPEDTGAYTCEAWNQYGEVHTQASLTVQEPQDGVQPWFITKPKNVSASLGQHVLLSCAIAGDPFPQYSWSRGGHELVSGPDFEVLQKEDIVSLLVRRTKRHHAGEYLITLRNKVGMCSCVASLSVSDGPGLSRGVPPDIQATPSGSFLRGTAGAGRGGRRGGGAGAVGPAVQQGGGQGAVEDLSRSQQQEQRAAAEEPRPALQEEPEEEEEQPAASAHRGLLKRRGVETKERGEEQLRQRQAEQLDFRSLLGRKVVTKSLSEEDLKESMAEQVDFRAGLNRTGGAKTKAPAASSTQQVDFRSMLKKGAGGGATAASPGPKAAVVALSPEPTKNADFRSVLANKKKQTSLEKNGEVVKPAVASDKGKENTAAGNCVGGGNIEKKSAVKGGGSESKVAPTFSQKLSDVTVVDGERLHLHCQVTSDPTTTVTWTLDGKVIKPSKFIVIANDGGLCSLTIDKALPEDEGQYKCRAENSAGQTDCSCMVLVDDPTDNNSTAADKKSKKSTTPTSESEARIKKPITKTPAKQGVPPQIVQFPDDMKILAGEKVDILCKFGGSQPITCIWLKFRKPIQEGTGDITIETTEASSKLTVADSQQEHCGCYTLELRNSYGLRQAALNLTIVDKPDPPARVPAASDIRRSTLTLSWYGPTYDGGSAVQSYNLEIWDSVGDKWTELASCNSTSYNVQNLLPERQYKFRVRAVNIYGIGEPSAESLPVTVGVEEEEEDENQEAEVSDDDSEKVPDYRDVTVRTDLKVKDLYDVEERLGTGKFGQVFKLVEKATKKVWAGKFIKAYSAKEKENVRQEIGIMNSLHHPKLVQCVDAFEGKSDIVMVLEMISGGELFERIIDEDFELTEREVIKYMLQIVDGVQFIHKQGIVHLDLKPENIMCVNKTSGKIKLIDFGLARRLENAGTLKVLFGTPEFVAPEVINYEAISYPTDMWSIGVICYILVSGLSPFMGDNDNETLSNVTSATWDFEDEAFDEISDNAKDFITMLLKKDMKARLTCAQCYEHPWLKQDTKNMEAKKLSKERMKKYILRRKWQKTGHAVRAIGRLSSMAMLAGVSAKKGSPTEEDNQFLECLEYEEKTQVKPTFSSVIKDVEVVEGSAARFDCKIEGYPDPEVVWYKDDHPIKETRHFQIDYDEDGNCCLVISEVSGDDDAKYTVKAVNSLGEATCTAELLVEVMAGEEEEEEEE